MDGTLMNPSQFESEWNWGMALQKKSISLASWSLHGSKHAHVQDISDMSLMGPKTHGLKRVIDTICALDHHITSCNNSELILDCYLQ